MSKIFEIHPKRPIHGILSNNVRLSEVTRMPLNRTEFLRCMHSATLYAMVDGERILVTSTDWDKALELFEKDVVLTAKTVILQDTVSINDKIITNNSGYDAINVNVVETPKVEESKIEEPKIEEETKVVETEEAAVELDEKSTVEETTNKDTEETKVVETEEAAVELDEKSTVVKNFNNNKNSNGKNNQKR